MVYFYTKERNMIVFPKAKINIGLHITRKRPDGYHDIETIFYPVNFTDALEFTESEEGENGDRFTETGIATGCPSDDNLVMKALRLLRDKYSFPILNIHLHKAIPSGAGLGGGSSDAAFLLKSVTRHYNLEANREMDKAMALEIGSDCPFFIDSAPSFASGRGEILKPVTPVLAGYYLVLLNPGVGISTGDAYRNSSPSIPENSLQKLFNDPPESWKESVFNDFEDYAFKIHPVIGELKSELYNSGAIFSLMSGSGSSVFGIFKSKPSLTGILKLCLIWEGSL